MKVNLQLRATFVYSTFGIFVFLTEWAGFRGKGEVWGYPRPLSEIWWHAPVWIAVTFVVIVVYRIVHRLLGGSGELPEI